MKIWKSATSDVKKLYEFPHRAVTPSIIVMMTFMLLVGNVVATEEWSKTFGERGIDWAWSVQQTLDGGYILAGSLSLSKVWLIKTDTNGNEQWSKTFGERSKAWSVQQTLDGGYILAGEIESYYASYYGASDGRWHKDGFLIKTDTNGNEQWSKTFGGSGNEVFQSVKQTSDGGYILAGSLYGSEVWLIKTDTNGNEQWSNTFGGKDYDSASSVQQTSDGGYILAGITESYGAGGWDAWLIKTDINGNEQWSKTFGGRDDDGAWSVQQISDGGYIITGGTKSYGAGGWDAWLIKTDTNGNEQWSRTFGGGDNDWTSSGQQTSDNGYILAGRTKSSGSGDYDVWIIKIGEKPQTLPGASGFEDIYAIVGLLAGVYLLGRKR